MSRTRPKKSKNAAIPMFISKLLQIVSNESITDVVSWTSTLDSFNIKNITRFTQEVLPSYFKHHNFASFIRQLNMYGFKKIRHPDGDNVYMNEHFQKGNPPQLANIVRKMREDKEEELELYGEDHDVPDGRRVGKQIHELRSKQKNLEDMCKRFLQQNQKLLQENQTLVKKMQKDSREKERRLEEFLLYLLAQKNSRAINGESAQLSITNSEGPALGEIKIEPYASSSIQATPLQVIGNSMDQDESFRKMKAMLQNAYNIRKSRRRERNFTIIPHRQEQDHLSQNDPLLSSMHHDESDLISGMHGDHFLRQEDNKSFLSINDFINAEEDQDFNMEESQ